MHVLMSVAQPSKAVHYLWREWTRRQHVAVGDKIPSTQLWRRLTKPCYTPHPHIKLGLVKNLVTAMDLTSPAL